MNIYFHPDAEKEIEQAVDWYDGLSRRLGNDFLRELEQSLERVEKFPEAWAIFLATTRRVACRSFLTELFIV